MNKNNVNLYDASVMFDHISQAIHQQQSILILTSTPSITNVLVETFPNHTIKQITGANNNEFKDIVEALKRHQVDVLVVGVEQLINPTKWDVFFPLIAFGLDHVMIEHAHQVARTNHDHRGEYLTLADIHKQCPSISWSLYTHALSKADFNQLSTTLNVTNKIKQSQNISLDYYPIHTEQKLQALINTAKNNNTLIVVHDYLYAEILGFMINQQTPCGVVTRKVEESTKVDTINAWQKGHLVCLITTSDTLLPYPYPNISTLVWAQIPLNHTQANEWHRRFSVNQSIVMDQITKKTYALATLHAFIWSEQLNHIIQVIKQHQNGITLREMEQFINMDSYTFEKVLKGLTALRAIKKEKAVYVINQPWQIHQNQIKAIQTTLKKEHHQLINHLREHTNETNQIIDPKTRQTYNHLPYPLRPKILFPRGFYPKSLIPSHLKSEMGYVFATAYTDVKTRTNDIIQLLHRLSIPLSKTSFVPLSVHNDNIDQLVNTLAQHDNVTTTRVFGDFDSSILKESKNPYHKMIVIQNQLKLQQQDPLEAITVVIADHADHTWHMAAVAYELLSKKMTDRVIVIFNQP